MELSEPIEVFNLDSFLPSDGEDKVEMSYVDGTLNLDIFYDSVSIEFGAAKRRFRFPQAKHFFKTPFPGYSFFYCQDHREKPLLNSVVMYAHSDWIEASGASGYKHFRVFLHSVGIAIHVISESCELSEEELLM
jgi:hypothetical protein